MFFGCHQTATESEIKARIKREQKEQEEREIKRKNKIKEARLTNLKKAREARLLRKQLRQLTKEALIELVVELRKKDSELNMKLEKKHYEVIDAEHRGYRQAGEDRYNSLSKEEKDRIQWERDRASDRLVN